MASSEVRTEQLIVAGRQVKANDIRDEDTPVSGGPHDTFDLVGDGVSAADAGNGQVDIDIPAPVSGGGIGAWMETPPAVGEEFGPKDATGLGMTATVANVIQFVPWFIPIPMTVDRMGWYSFSTPGGQFWQGGIYSHVQGRPSVKLVQTPVTQYNSSSDFVSLFTAPLALPVGLVYLAWQTASPITQTITIQPSAAQGYNGFVFNASTFGTAGIAWRYTHNPGSFILPASISPGLFTADANDLFLQSIRRSA
jgi:hypothetical protein